MRMDRFHIKMEDISPYPLERSADCQEWEDISYQELEEVLNTVSEEKAKVFLGVVRNGSFASLDGYFYRIRPRH
ncbi:conserved protein of unknown function [Nitrospina watsonii]|uniref:Uncharacterized protein n=2 Tax=Nitrospina watsonii TaxID=1323948 RepID=A0ABN8W6V9_9BACT|nr:conserved protein of unknown function [Nitrospina watsonii]